MGTDDPELASDIANDAFASYFTPQLVNPDDPESPIKLPKILITTSVGAGKNTIEFCMDLTSVLPNSEYVKRRGGKGYEIATIAGWAKKREYTDMMVINEDHKTPSESLHRHSRRADTCRRHHAYASAVWSNSLFQTDISQVVEGHHSELHFSMFLADPITGSCSPFTPPS